MTEDKDPPSARLRHGQAPQPEPSPTAEEKRFPWLWSLIGAAAATLAVAALATGYQPPWATLRTASDELKEEDLNKCVSQAFDRIGRDIAPAQLNLHRWPMANTDDAEMYEVLIQRILPSLAKNRGDNEGQPRHHIGFKLFFDSKQRGVRHFGASIICINPFRTEDNQCRNRNYYFFSRRTPEELADILLSDITSTEITMRDCAFEWASRTPKPAAPERRATGEENR